MSTDTPLARHYKEVRRHSKTRRRLAARSWTEASTWTRQEARLVVHLQAAAELGAGESTQAPTKREDAFTYWVARRLTEPESSALAALLAGIAAGGASANAARDALHLMPPADDASIAGTELWREPDVRLAFLEAAAQGRSELSSGLVNQALDQEPATQAAAIQVIGTDASAPVSRFRDWFQASTDATAMPARAAAVFAGLVRGDEQAQHVLPKLLEQADDSTQRHTVLRLMALAGRPADRASLVAYTETEPSAGAYLLGVHAHPANLDALVDLLERPEAAETAAEAWWRITGVTLPRRPRLQSTDDSDAAARGEMPDAEWATGWLDSHRNELPPADQLLFGRGMDARSLARECRRWAGTASVDLIYQAQRFVGPFPALAPAPWLQQRLARLDAAGLHDTITIPPEVDTADPWEHGHYA